MNEFPMSKNMQDILATIADARNGEISGWSIARWLNKREFPNKSRYPEGVREGLRALVNRGLITMRPMDDPKDDWSKAFPNRLTAMYSIAKRPLPNSTSQT